MALGVGTRIGKGQGEGRTARAAVATAGRAALWALVGLLLIRGVASVLSGPEHGERQPVAGRGALDPATGAFAVRFARAYLGGSSPQELAPLLAPGVRGVSTTTASGVAVAQAEVAGVQALGAGQAIVTVACELGDARTIFLAVPIVRASAGEVAASGAPAVVAGPAGVGEDVESPRPLAGPGATAIGDLVRRFLPAYFSASSPDDLAYLLAPGAEVVPPGNGLQLPRRPQRQADRGRRRRAANGARHRAGSRSAERRGLSARLPARGRPARALVRRSGRGSALVKRRFGVALLLALAAAVLLAAPAAALAASGNDVGHNIGSTLRHYAGEVYGGVLAIVGLVFLLNRKFTDLAVFFVAAVLVGWLVFSPDQVAEAARAIGQRILP